LGAAIFTKLQAFEESRKFLSQMASDDAEMVLSLVKEQPLNRTPPELLTQRRVVFRRNGQLVWGSNTGGDLAVAHLNARNGDTVKRFGEHYWVISSRCAQEDCVIVAIRDTERKFAIRRLVVSIFLPLLLVFSATLFMTYLAIRIGLRPLDRLTDDLNSVDLEKLEKLPRNNHPKELRPLVRAIDTLTLRMQDQIDRERAFLDACAHEIRTPVTGLVSQVQTLMQLKGGALSKCQRTQLNHIENSARRTGRIADQFLGLARTNNSFSGGQGTQDFNLCEVVRLVLSEFAERHTNLNIELVAPERIGIHGDPFALELIVQNLIDNAIKHSGREKNLEILVACADTREGPTLCVQDNGEGVDQGNIELITQRFVRFAGKQHLGSRNSNGAGLGLSIVQEIISAWGGGLSFDQDGSLSGFCVRVSFPAQKR
jgi:signal transduction histidine kinase